MTLTVNMLDSSLPRLRVVVLAGGDSAERFISLASGRAAAAALAAVGHEVASIDPAQTDLGDIDWTRHDACFIALHGGAGEDGRVQSRLDELGVPYTGSGPEASRLAMSKSASKERFSAAGIPTPPHVLLRGANGATHLGWCRLLGYPLVVKPDGQGSSLGVSLVNDEAALPGALAAALALDPLVLAERWVGPREFTVAALLDRRPLPLMEILPAESILSFDAK